MRKARPARWRPPSRWAGAAPLHQVECRFSFACGEARKLPRAATSRTRAHLPTPAKSLAILLLPLTLAACLDSDDTRSTSFVESANAEQPFPANYKPEILAFLKTYLNNPAGVHEAAIAEPVQRTVNGRVRYVSCLRFAERQSDGT